MLIAMSLGTDSPALSHRSHGGGRVPRVPQAPLFSLLVLKPEDSGVRNCRGDKEVSEGNRNHWKRIVSKSCYSSFLMSINTSY